MKVLALFLLLAATHSYAQDFPKKEIDLEKFIDEIFPVQDDDLNYEDLYETLAQLLSDPIDLNTITIEQMRSLLVISEEEINSFFQYRNENTPLLSVYELQSVPHWDRSTFDKIIPFVTVNDVQSRLNSSIIRRIAEENNNYLVMRYERSLETKHGYSTATDSSQRYLGGPEKLYMRYRVSRSNDFSVGFTGEKDAGEQLLWSPATKTYGFDFTSFHLQLLNKGRLKNLIAGDFQSQFGQGLVLGSVFGFGKNSETITTVRRSNLGFLPYSSAGESLFFRGAAASYSLTKKIILHSFHSQTYRDGSLNVSDQDVSISSLTASGLHRTTTEVQRRQSIFESDHGGVLQFKNQQLDAGIIFIQTTFDQPVLRTAFPYNQFAFNGRQNQNVSAYMNFSIANFSFFGEHAQTLGSGAAFTAGLLGSLTRQLEVSILYRDFDKDFHSFYSNAFAESTSPQNEQGLYWGWKYTFNKKYSATGYMDIFRFPWLRYRGYSPSEGSEWLLRFNYNPSKKTLLFFQMREETKIRNYSEEAPLYITENGSKRNYWINCEYIASPNITLKSRLQFSTFEFDSRTTRGMALIQDINISAGRWGIGLRHALFDTGDYDNRLYVFEKNVWLAYSFPAYYGKGVRNYVVVQYSFSKKLDAWLRWSHVRYIDRETIGTGGEIVAGNSGNDVKFQIRVKF